MIIKKKFRNKKLFRLVKQHSDKFFRLIPRSQQEREEQGEVYYGTLSALFSYDKKGNIVLPNKHIKDMFMAIIGYLDKSFMRDDNPFIAILDDEYLKMNHLSTISPVDTWDEIFIKTNEDKWNTAFIENEKRSFQSPIEIEEDISPVDGVVLTTRCMGQIDISSPDQLLSEEETRDKLLRRMVKILSNTHRYSGQIDYTVLNHCVAVADEVSKKYDGTFKEVAYKFALLHEYFEGIVGLDIPTPFKYIQGMDYFRQLENEWEIEVFANYFADYAEQYANIKTAVKTADTFVGAVEAFWFMCRDEKTGQINKLKTDIWLDMIKDPDIKTEATQIRDTLLKDPDIVPSQINTLEFNQIVDLYLHQFKVELLKDLKPKHTSS